MITCMQTKASKNIYLWQFFQNWFLSSKLRNLEDSKNILDVGKYTVSQKTGRDVYYIS